MKKFDEILLEMKIDELEVCTMDGGGSGWKFGNGPCYLDKKDAIKMMIAAKLDDASTTSNVGDFSRPQLFKPPMRRNKRKY